MKFEELNSKEMVIKIQSGKEFRRVERYLDKVEIKLDKGCDFYDKEYRVCLKIYGETACMWGKSFLKTCEVFLLSDIDEFKECKNWTMRCVDDNNQNFIKNKIYKVTDNKITNELTHTFGIRTALILKSFDAWVEFATSKWELISIDDETEVIKELPQIDLSNRYISIVDDENRYLLFNMLEEQGFVWGFGGEKPREWHQWKAVTRIQITDCEIYNASWRDNCKNFSDILKQYEEQKLQDRIKQVAKSDFTKSDLKDGMIIENRAGKRRLVIGENLTGKDGFSIIANYKEDLKSKFNEELDIIKIYKSQYVHILTDIFDNKNLELIWERKENTPPKWTDWKPVEYCELFQFRQKDSKIEVRRPSIKGITVSSTCLSTDVFDLKYGQELCIKKWNIEYAKKQLDDFIKEN